MFDEDRLRRGEGGHEEDDEGEGAPWGCWRKLAACASSCARSWDCRCSRVAWNRFKLLPEAVRVTMAGDWWRERKGEGGAVCTASARAGSGGEPEGE